MKCIDISMNKIKYKCTDLRIHVISKRENYYF